MGEGRTGYGTREFAVALGLTIKVLRTDRSLERKELAERAGISYSHLAAIEAGQKQPSPTVLTALAAALGIASHELLESVDQRRQRRLDADPWWLTADAARPAPAPAAAAMAPRPARVPYRPDPVALADFIHEITTLAEHLGEKERAVLLELARKLAQR
jgi:transcriptional regulator with XRE-family HTH domain